MVNLRKNVIPGGLDSQGGRTARQVLWICGSVDGDSNREFRIDHARRFTAIDAKVETRLSMSPSAWTVR
jgi:hypothetical protein